MPRQREFDKAEVIGRAVQVFQDRGYEATSMRDLLDAMGISSSSLYSVFGDKRGVFLAALERFCEGERAWVAQMAQETSLPERFVERLFESVEAAAKPDAAVKGSLALSAMVEFGTRDPGVTQLLLNHYFGIAEIVTGVMARGQEQGVIKPEHDPRVLADTILSTLYGVATMKGVNPTFAHVHSIRQQMNRLIHS
jgi:TetR/AcrR family transcriptional regulator, transcriptional repressor for nem operon